MAPLETAAETAPPVESSRNTAKAKSPRPGRAQFLALLKKHQGKLLPIEKETGWSRRTLRTLIKEYDLEHLRSEPAADDV